MNQTLFINQIFFEPDRRSEQTRQSRQTFPPRQNSASYKNIFLPQNHMNTHQPNQTHNEVPLPCYLQQHEITKTYLTNFSQIPNTAKSLQMTTNPYLMVGSSISSNKPLMVSTGTDPGYSLETI